MNLYLLEQDEITGWNTYDSCVVAAEDETAAKLIHPREGSITDNDGWNSKGYDWPNKPESINASLLGIAELGTSAGVICASFNAG